MTEQEPAEDLSPESNIAENMVLLTELLQDTPDGEIRVVMDAGRIVEIRVTKIYQPVP